MSGWLDALRAALDTRPTPVWFFFRDDDAGWDDTALEALLDVFEPHGLPLDVATIPLAATSRTVEVITTRQTSGRNDLRVHQHGLAHVNHEPVGRPCEFGVSRPITSTAESIMVRSGVFSFSGWDTDDEGVVSLEVVRVVGEGQPPARRHLLEPTVLDVLDGAVAVTETDDAHGSGHHQHVPGDPRSSLPRPRHSGRARSCEHGRRRPGGTMELTPVVGGPNL